LPRQQRASGRERERERERERQRERVREKVQFCSKLVPFTEYNYFYIYGNGLA
jgi:hypothetical protein